MKNQLQNWWKPFYRVSIRFLKQEIQKRHPFLDEQAATALERSMQQYLTNKVEFQKLNRSLELPEIAQNPAELQKVCSEVGLLETQIERAYLRWEELEQKLRGEK